ncbi:MAG: hypothetical protein JWP70_2210 [Leifsonia sp.]|jgi:hypothetical protein|nr:hypothetical protein [Leifsonia sp.]MDQ1587981.1 hypothetical protein [Microbacteriaceae bacterium]HEV7567643.1 hypothetical protein [Microbacteriaceae bacterium]
MPRIRKSTSLKFAAVAIGVAGIVGLTISSAASLNLSGGSVGAGSSVVASCQTSGPIGVTFTNVYTPAVSGYTVTSVKLSGVDAACLGQQLKVSLTATGGTSLIEVTGPGAGGTAVTGLNTITVTGNILATAVVGTSVVIYN